MHLRSGAARCSSARSLAFAWNGLAQSINSAVGRVFGACCRAICGHCDGKNQAAHGYQLLKRPTLNRGVSTPSSRRAGLGLRGLLPAGVVPLDTQLEVAMEQLRSKPTDLEKYIFLQTLQDSREDLYLAALMKYTEECMPLVYTPTVGQACMQFHRIARHTPRGLYISLDDIGHVREALGNWPERGVRAVVVTDGERILGLGDLGTNGMGIPVGKLALYAACAGIHPEACLPVTIDVGTENEKLKADPAYPGLRRKRERGPAYDALVEEFMVAVQERYGRDVLVQFEDFGNTNAFRILDKFRGRANCFNDDIQGTAAVALAGIIASEKITKTSLDKHTFLFYGAGEAGVGIAELIAAALAEQLGTTVEEARKHIWLIDSQGLVTSDRLGPKLAHHKVPYAHPAPPPAEAADGTLGGEGVLLDAIRRTKPTALIGVSAQPATFTQKVCELMAETSARPVIMALSNPTSKAECTAEQAYRWTKGRCVFASGSPMPGITLEDGTRLEPGQGNNAYIFPGVGLGAIGAGARTIDDGAFLVTARALASMVDDESIAHGTVYPPLSSIRNISLEIAHQVAEHFYKVGAATAPRPADLRAHLQGMMYSPWADAAKP